MADVKYCSDDDAKRERTLDLEVHRPQMRFVLIDEIVRLDPGRSVHARRSWPAELELFADHFPNMPVVPGVLLTEMMGQAAACCVEAVEPAPGKAMLVQIRNAVFRRWVRPGEPIDVHAEIRSQTGRTSTAACHSEVGGVLVAQAELLFSFVSWDAVGGSRNEVLERYRRDRGS
jgi:3-hydroxyacyl-[acyl-carrier-protein] dehydratase